MPQTRADTLLPPIGVSGAYRVNITADPIGLEGGVNLFGYVGGDPINSVDPEGLLSFGGGFGGFVGIVGGQFDITYVSCCEKGIIHHYTVLNYAYGLGLGANIGPRISPTSLLGPSSCPVRNGTKKYVCGSFAFYGGAQGCVPAENRIFNFTGGNWSIIGGLGGNISVMQMTTQILQDVTGGCCGR
ncbi:MAG: hypothetical protein A4E58_00276 [Syntrophorhabdus sp. PtaB.Bin006]|nr:MAG: hypothetical protein A4E58_00276 [Syntrophorhabdus sp. PtaB.Bin006]